MRLSATWSSGLFDAARGYDVGQRSWAIRKSSVREDWGAMRGKSCSVRGKVLIVWQQGWETKGWRQGVYGRTCWARRVYGRTTRSQQCTQKTDSSSENQRSGSRCPFPRPIRFASDMKDFSPYMVIRDTRRSYG